MTGYRFDDSTTPAAPIVELTVGTPDGARTAKLPGLLDTGADWTTIPAFLVPALDLQPLGDSSITGFGGVSISVSTYLVSTEIRDLQRHIVKVAAADEPIVLIGRDVLNHFRVTLDGPRGLFEIAESTTDN